MQAEAFVSSPESLTALTRGISSGLALFMPPAELTVSQWADKFARLPAEGSPEPGPWLTDRAPYQREMMDVVSDPGIDTVVYMIASQCGKTACEFNVLWYYVHQDPSPILFVLPTEKTAEDVSKERLATAIRDTPVLTPLFGNPKTRDSGNAIMNKKFPGGFLALAGANAPRGLASRPVRILIMDEIDGYPASAGTEGDPITIAEARTTNFWNRKKIYSSTPTIKNASRSEKLYSNSDQRKYHVPCPQCGEFQTLEWESLKWPSPSSGAQKHRPNECYYVCINGCVITEADKMDMLRRGKWIKMAPDNGDGKTAGFHLSVLYSPWKNWPDLINDWLKAHKFPEQRKAFWNTRLARTYETVGESIDDGSLFGRRIVYEAEVPERALVLTAGLDVQADRIEMEVVGWGKDEESWSIDYHIFRGNPATSELWSQVDEALKHRYRHASGVMLRIASAFVDSGYHAKQVYRFCRPRQVRRVFACKGVSGAGVPLLKPRAQSRTRTARIDLRILGIDSAKESLYANLKLKEIGPGFCHFPSGYVNEQGALVDRSKIYEQEYFLQLTAEKLITEMQGMTPIRKWEKKRERNEALDCRVYAMAALEDLNIRNWDKLAKNLSAAAEKTSESAEREKDIEREKPKAAVADAKAEDSIPTILGKQRPNSQSKANWRNAWNVHG